MARSMKPVAGYGTMGPPPNPNPRPGGVPKGKFGPTAALVASGQGQNRMGGRGTAGAGKFRGTSRVANAINARQPTGPFRAKPELVNRPRSKGQPAGG